ncbi:MULTISPECIES: sensor histidine kinase [unclassified Polaribacter]|uniref:sensor histidine kinase n=1 Tax=unclassified Polaribacter TaxID=196858 RepID=UPI0011BEC9A8|nr:MULTISPECIES: HAMP domain-containing sensor histidine kinase [unclassified Polaribacter]TXD53617.1 HAMP domain-containing histidine kinase [Polaribacter sp. IC063]TXD62142.1 HAMP domain-containing histidine kinase [Polaribacter sp. IC066]
MNKKIRLLIVISSLGLLALSVIQGYLINNTYKLKKTAFIAETKKSISRLDDLSPKLDGINETLQDNFLNLIADYYVKKITKKQVLEKLNSYTDSINRVYIESYEKELKEQEIGYDLKFQKVVNTIIVLDSAGIKNDTIFSSLKTPSFHLLGHKFDEKDGHKISNSLWLTDHVFNRKVNGEMRSITFNLQLETEDRMNIDGWERIVFGRMAILLGMSIFIFLLVFWLLYYSIINLITQKKIVDIKTDFVNNITHELKTPLSTLTLATKMLQNDEMVLASAPSKNIVNTIERQNIRLQKLIDQVVNNSLGYQEIKLNKELVNANEYLNLIVDDFQLSLNLANIQISKNINIDIPLSVDKFYFTTAVLNILENAVKYGKENLKIVISANITADFKLIISDNGIGIPKKEVPFLFDKFFRVGNKEVHDVKGLGLGLYYTNQIVKAHQGKILVESKQGKGTSFTILIPIA